MVQMFIIDLKAQLLIITIPEKWTPQRAIGRTFCQTMLAHDAMATEIPIVIFTNISSTATIFNNIQFQIDKRKMVLNLMKVSCHEMIKGY